MKPFLYKFFLLSIILLFSSALVKATTVMIWEPEGDNTYGHAAIQTKTYHMSLWPANSAEKKWANWGEWERGAFLSGVAGSLIFHHNWDAYLERTDRNSNKSRKPTHQYDLESFSDRSIDEAYEAVLNYNNITPDKVTLERGEELLMKGTGTAIDLPRSLWRLEGEYYTSTSFYKYPQSCTTFSTALLSFNNEKVVQFLDKKVRARQPMLGGLHGIEPSNPLIRGSLTVVGFRDIVRELEENKHLKEEEGNGCVIF